MTLALERRHCHRHATTAIRRIEGACIEITTADEELTERIEELRPRILAPAKQWQPRAMIAANRIARHRQQHRMWSDLDERVTSRGGKRSQRVGKTHGPAKLLRPIGRRRQFTGARLLPRQIRHQRHRGVRERQTRKRSFKGGQRRFDQR